MLKLITVARNEEMPKVSKQLAETRAFQKELEDAGKQDTDRYRHAKAVEQELRRLGDKFMWNVRQVGVAGRLKQTGRIDVLPWMMPSI
jgi:hypothetical protein